MRVEYRTMIAAALFAVAGCGGGGEPVATDPNPVLDLDGGAVATGPPMACKGVLAKVGSGVREFMPVEDGDTLPLYKGPQGGFMIYLSIQAKGLDPSYVNVHYEERYVTGAGLDGTGLFGIGDWKVQLTNDLGDGWFERVGIWGEIEPELWTKPGAVRDKDIVMKVTLTDKAGCTVGPLGWSIHVDPEPGR